MTVVTRQAENSEPEIRQVSPKMGGKHQSS